MEYNGIEIENEEISRFYGVATKNRPETIQDLKEHLKEILKVIAESPLLSKILQTYSAGYDFPESFEQSKVATGEKLSLMIPEKDVIPFSVNLVYSIVTGRVSCKDLLDNYFYSPFGEGKECKLFLDTIVLNMANAFAKVCSPDSDNDVETEKAKPEEKIKELVTILSQIRGLISMSGAIMQDKKSELISVSSGMIDYAQAGDGRRYRILSIGFINTLNTAHQSLELKEKLSQLASIEAELGFGG
ncbi:MAG: hypothetical protein J6Y68_01525 [Clostridia bacterium]|nr:hypothetical protein [Clostridia bacterium]